MKIINTEVITNRSASLEEIKYIIDNLFTDDSEVWLCLTDTEFDNNDYLQIHCDVDVRKAEVRNFLIDVLDYDEERLENTEKVYLIEYRKYENSDEFKHYRGFLPSSDMVYSYFEKFMNDEKLDVNTWYDVTEEFDKLEDSKNTEIISSIFKIIVIIVILLILILVFVIN